VLAAVALLHPGRAQRADDVDCKPAAYLGCRILCAHQYSAGLEEPDAAADRGRQHYLAPELCHLWQAKVPKVGVSGVLGGGLANAIAMLTRSGLFDIGAARVARFTARKARCP
jgi:hypothetical protein